jgi:hypothetical protein
MRHDRPRAPYTLEVNVGGAWRAVTDEGVAVTRSTVGAACAELARRYPVTYPRALEGHDVTVRVVDRWGDATRLLVPS